MEKISKDSCWAKDRGTLDTAQPSSPGSFVHKPGRARQSSGWGIRQGKLVESLESAIYYSHDPYMFCTVPSCRGMPQSLLFDDSLMEI